MFKGIKNTYKKAEAAVVVQNLLEHYFNNSLGCEKYNAADIANLFVRKAFELAPDALNGKFGRRPHKITVAFVALANAAACIHDDPENNDHTLFSAVGISLVNLQNELDINGGLYDLAQIDHTLLSRFQQMMTEIAEERVAMWQ